MDDEPLSFNEHRRRRDENASTVRCARCGKWITATATRCPECGVHFHGEAQEFAHPSERPKSVAGLPTWVVGLAVLLLVTVVVGLVGGR
jgi:predicted amidophosphoribosyltransferase